MIEGSRVRIRGQLSVLTLISVSVPPRFTAVARKRSRSFCQKCLWQVTAKHAYTLRMWLCMKWHGAWLYGVHRTCAETAAVSCGTGYASAVYATPTHLSLRWIFRKTCYKKLVSHVESHASAVSLLESGKFVEHLIHLCPKNTKETNQWAHSQTSVSLYVLQSPKTVSRNFRFKTLTKPGWWWWWKSLFSGDNSVLKKKSLKESKSYWPTNPCWERAGYK